jgi:Zn-dependent protease with chaperone function
MSLQETVRYEGLSSKSYEHPADRAATAALRSIPLMDKVLKRLAGFGHERQLRQYLIGNAVQISPAQVPDLWARHAWTASVLDVPVVPDLFVTQTPVANALTVGANRPMVVIFSGLAKDYTAPEVDAVLAHEMGHVLSEHNYYQTALQFLALLLARSGALGGPWAGLPMTAIYLVLLEWSRAAELSADRASALVVGDPMVTCQLLMRVAGGALDGMSLDAFIAQAAAYADEEDVIARWSRAWMEARLTHPFAVKRTRELMSWVDDGSFDRLRSGQYLRRGQEPPVTAEAQKAVAHYRERFFRILGTATGGVDRALRQLEDWLRPNRGSTGADEGADDGADLQE